ncbi:winged helix-turn-helix domain-containing protein [Vibrio coralliilyticus]|uniref:OmpR/PhoB-type domain-containing protein n=1 Tax=Vibrio coralliilyticus TaxID=190893 RepID=A0AAP6ZTM9_9VIBR|nr:winged helix-turn-helix domain-containing protein [Vibrio coralliilyticus]NOJ24273.1 hypothetical protein [Vibrio coralliilyticus]
MVKKLIYSTSTRRLSTGNINSLTKLAESDYSVLKNLTLAFPSGLDKETLTELAWPEKIVTESSLKVSIHKLRRVLNDELGLKIQIIYIRGIGYLLSESIALVVKDISQEELEIRSNIDRFQGFKKISSLFSKVSDILVTIISLILIIVILKFYSMVGLL